MQPQVKMFNELTPFSGKITESWSKWIDNFRTNATACDWNEKRMLQILLSLLIDKAQKFYKDIPDNEKTTFNALEKALELKIRTPELSRLKVAQFHAALQLPGETADTFADRLSDLFADAYGNTMPSKEKDLLLLNQFINNIRPDLKKCFAYANAKDFLTAISVTTAIELQKHNELISTVSSDTDHQDRKPSQTDSILTAMQQGIKDMTQLLRKEKSDDSRNPDINAKDDLQDMKDMLNKLMQNKTNSCRTM